jgi:predicted nuclease with TOPRIM domain
MSQYEMIVVNESVVVKSGSLSETYSLTNQPSKSSLLVKEEKQAILGQIDLRQMLENLDSCVDLLQIAYNAVNGMKGLHASVSDLQLKLADNLILSNETIQRFCYKTDSIIGKFLDAYSYLISGNEDIALEILAEVKEDATLMRQDAEKLGAKFAAVADKTEVVLTETINRNTANYEKRDAIIAESNRMAAEAAAFEVLKKNLEATIQDLNTEYNSLQKKQEKAEERSFALQLTGAILGGLGIVAQSAGEMQDSQPTTGGTDVNAQTQKDLEQAKKDQAATEAAIKDLDTQIADIDAKLDAATEAEREPLRTQKEELLKQKTEKNKSLEGQKAKTDTLAKSAAAVGDGFSQMGEKMQEYADKYDARLTEIFALRKELERQERENLMKLAEYTKKIANAVIDKDSLETAIASLIVAIGCLRKVVSHLKDMVAFWKSIEVCCESLAGGDTIKSVERLQKKFSALPSTDENLVKRVQPYKEIGFMRVFLNYLVRWVALNEICKEYLEALQLTRSRLNETIREDEKGREDHWAQASMLAGRLNEKLNGQLGQTV